MIERQNRTHGQLLRDIPAHDLFEASKALELLRPLRIGLLEAVTGFVADHQRRSESKTFEQAFDAYEGMPDDRTYLRLVPHIGFQVDLGTISCIRRSNFLDFGESNAL